MPSANPSGQIAGKEGRFYVLTGTGTLHEVTMDDYRVAATADDIPDRSSTARGRTNHDAGFTPVKVHVHGYWDKANNMHQTPFFIRSGEKIDTELWVDQVGVFVYALPSLFIEDCSVKDVTAERAEYTIDGWSDGPFTLPSGG